MQWEFGSKNIFHLSKLWKVKFSECTVWRNISGEAAGEIDYSWEDGIRGYWQAA